MVPLMLCIMMLSWSSLAEATIYYVDPAGSDSNNGTSEATPFQTFRKGVQVLGAGDTVYIKNGTYEESSYVQISNVTGTQANPIKILAYPGHAPVIHWINDTITAPVYSRLVLQRTPHNLPIAYITVEGLRFQGGASGIRWYNCQNCTIRRNTIDDPYASGILGTGGLDTLIEDNIIISAGSLEGGAHGLYLNGSRYTVKNNIIYDSQKYGIQLNGTASPTDTVNYPSADFAKTDDVIIVNNTLAYQREAAGLVIWGQYVNNLRVENNIFYENAQTGSNNCITFVSSGSTGITVRNNLAYASGSGATNCIEVDPNMPEGVNWTQSGNSINSSLPGFVNGGSNILPGSPDWTLSSASAAVINLGRVNEYPYNSSAPDAGAFEAVPTPTASITANTITLSFPSNLNTPLQNLSTTGVTVGCTGIACPGSPTVSGVARPSGLDTQVELTISGITGNACEATNQTWTVSYDSDIGTWTDSAMIGAPPGVNQKVFSFTGLAVTNNCSGSGPSGYPAGYLIYYKFDEGTGTSANDESANNLDGTLVPDATWGTGKSGSAVSIAAGGNGKVAVPWGSGVNPFIQDLTIVAPVDIAVGAENATHYVVGPDHGTNQRFYVCGQNGVWKLALQSTTCTNAAASNLPVTSGWNHLTVQFNSSTHIATLYKDGVAGTGGAVVPYTSYTFASNLNLGQVFTLSTTGGLYDDFLVYLSLVDPATIFAAFQAVPPVIGGTLNQEAVQAQAIYLTGVGDAPTNFGTLAASKTVVVNGGVAWVFQVTCAAGADCGETAFRLAYRKNGAGAWKQIPDVETSDHIWMWGTDTNSYLNRGTIAGRLTGACTYIGSSTLLTSAQIPTITLAQGECFAFRYLVRIGDTVGDYFELRLETQGGVALTGSYTYARINAVPPQSSAGF